MVQRSKFFSFSGNSLAYNNYFNRAVRTAKFGLLRRGEYIGVKVLLNTLTKFGKLSVGEHVVSAK